MYTPDPADWVFLDPSVYMFIMLCRFDTLFVYSAASCLLRICVLNWGLMLMDGFVRSEEWVKEAMSCVRTAIILWCACSLSLPGVCMKLMLS